VGTPVKEADMLDRSSTFEVTLPPELFQTVDALGAVRGATQLAELAKYLALRTGLFLGAAMIGSTPEMKERAYDALRAVGEQMVRFSRFLADPSKEGEVHPVVDAILREAAAKRSSSADVLARMGQMTQRIASRGMEGQHLTEAQLEEVIDLAHGDFILWSKAFAATVDEGVARARADLAKKVEESRRNAEKSRDRIAQIARVIRLIALNARVEASRAGEAGRAFGVLADEIKALSEQTSAASQEVQRDIARITAILETGG
jgi:hypothetical protein